MKKSITLLQKHCAVLTLLFLLAFIHQSCTKTNEAARAVTTTPVDNFLTLPPGTNPELQPVAENLQQQFQKNNFAANFLAWHGQPVWNQAIKIKSNTDDVILLIPTIKANAITAFIEVLYNKEKFFYGLHRKSSITNTIKEYSNIGFDEAAVKWFMDYFDAKLGTNTTANKSNLVDPPYCWFEPCTNGGGYSKTGTASANPVPNQPCWIQHCEEGGGGGGGGNGGGDTGGGGGNPGPTPNPCPVNDGWYNIIPPPPCDVPDPNGCASAEATLNNAIQSVAVAEKVSILPSLQTANTREFLLQWKFVKHVLGAWYFTSHEHAYHKKVNGVWQWDKLTHESINRVGNMVGVDVTCTILDTQIVIGTYYSGIQLKYAIKGSLVCKGFPIYSDTPELSSEAKWHVNDTK